jgi:hypothetical protein
MSPFTLDTPDTQPLLSDQDHDNMHAANQKDHTADVEVENVDYTVTDVDAASNVHKQPLPDTLVSLSEDEYRRVGRMAVLKTDIQILPCLVIMFIMNFLDRQNIASAKLANIEEDLGLSDVQYQTCVYVSTRPTRIEH